MGNVLGIISIICVAVYIIADKVTDYFKKSQSHPNGDSSVPPDTER